VNEIYLDVSTILLENVQFSSSKIISESDALLVIDIQNDFLPGGALAVPKGDKIIPGINSLRDIFVKNNQIIFTQDWHPSGHFSFASVHEGKNPFDPYSAPGLGPILWPDHCVQGQLGASFSEDITSDMATMILRKGYHLKIDSYSAFLENDKQTNTGLDAYLKSHNVSRVFICGLAFDYCVKYTAIDAMSFGYESYVILDLTLPVEIDQSINRALIDNLSSKGIKFIKSSLLKV
jgi:nicotinamidase/pyrazinamidase